MGLLAPSLLLGLVAAVVPYLIHRLGRRPPRPQPFAAMELLLAAERRVRARHRLRELLLLILRTGVAAALPLVFARPFVERATDAPALALAPQSAVLVLDDSASMQRRVGRSTPFALARDRALAITRQMTTGSALAVVLASEGNHAPIAELTMEKSRVSEALEQAKPTARVADFSGAVRRAATILTSASHEERRIYVLTDAQAAGWGEGALHGGEGAPELAVLDVTKGASWKNRAVVDLEAEPLAEGGPTAVAITATVADWGHDTAETINLTLKLDGTVVAKGTAEVPAGGQVRKRFVHTLGEAASGLHEVEVSVEEDDFPLDDRRYASLAMLQALRVLFINGDARTVRNEDEGFFLESALQSAGAGVSVTSVLPDEAAELDLSNFGVVFVANVGEPSEALAQRLASFVSKGGGVFFSTGAHVNADVWNSRLGGLLPQPVGLIRTAATQDQAPAGELVDDRPAERLAPLDRRHPLLAQFTTGEDGLASARFYKYTLLEPVPDDNRHVVLRFESGAPALVERVVPAGSRRGPPGRVMLLATTIDREWADLAIRPGFLPLMIEATRRLAGAPEGGNGADLLVGQAQTLSYQGAEESLEVRKPNGSTWVAHRRNQPSGRSVRFTETQQPGVYHVRVGTGADEARLEDPNRIFVVNLDTAESNPTRRDPKPLAGGAAESEGGRPLHKVPLWHALAMAIILLLAAESLVTFRRRGPAHLSPPRP